MGVLIMLALVGLFLFKGWLAFLGIEFHLGVIAAISVLGIAIFFRFALLISIGSYFGAVDVMGWPWWVGLLIALPGLFFLVPSMFMIAWSQLWEAGRKNLSPENVLRRKKPKDSPDASFIEPHGSVQWRSSNPQKNFWREKRYFTEETQCSRSQNSNERIVRECENSDCGTLLNLPRGRAGWVRCPNCNRRQHIDTRI